MEYIKHFLSIQQQIRMYHWTTKIYNQHVITGKLYEKLDELIDKFVEVLLSTHKVEPCNLKIKTIPCTKDGLLKVLKQFIVFLQTLELSTDLLNIRDEITGEVHRHLYLLEMN